jgi:hypothetical protein
VAILDSWAVGADASYRVYSDFFGWRSLVKRLFSTAARETLRGWGHGRHLLPGAAGNELPTSPDPSDSHLEGDFGN